MQGQTSEPECNNVIRTTQRMARKAVFAQAMKGVYSATVTKKKFQFGKPGDGYDYRRFYYNDNGDVVRRISFNESGDIEMKEQTEYNRDGKILSSRFIMADNFVQEKFEYNDEGRLVKYTLSNPKMPADKYEVNELDAKGRVVKTTSFGLMGTPEYISHYLYAGEEDETYRVKHVTKADGMLLITFYFTYESGKKQNNLTGIYGFYLPPSSVRKLVEEDKAWETKSAFRNVWEYEDGKPVNFFRDEQAQKIRLDLGPANTGERVVTERSSMQYETINRKRHLVKIIEWQTRFMEPWKEVKEYTYYDEADRQVFPPADAGEQNVSAVKTKSKAS